jgi:hypothetical protein
MNIQSRGCCNIKEINCVLLTNDVFINNLLQVAEKNRKCYKRLRRELGMRKNCLGWNYFNGKTKQYTNSAFKMF